MEALYDDDIFRRLKYWTQWMALKQKDEFLCFGVFLKNKGENLMSFTVNLCSEGLLINRFNSSNMSKSKQAKLQRQQERDNKVAFFEAQKENLKKRKADTLEEISEKLEMLHNYEDEIAAANQEYNNSQMFHVMDEAEERGVKIAKAAERNKPKTEEERKEEMVDEALGTEENKGVMSEIMDGLSETSEEIAEQISEKTVENLEELPDEVLQKQLASDSLETAKTVQTETIKRYVPIDIRV